MQQTDNRIMMHARSTTGAHAVPTVNFPIKHPQLALQWTNNPSNKAPQQKNFLNQIAACSKRPSTPPARCHRPAGHGEHVSNMRANSVSHMLQQSHHPIRQPDGNLASGIQALVLGWFINVAVTNYQGIPPVAPSVSVANGCGWAMFYVLCLGTIYSLVFE